ncbi:hypothetical protein BD769DRAFT_1630825 [Suillus cothurnatus]|nr:hypothetical protein BD769DRAFT_1630825 [Suillus cothurnatus]
MLQSPREPSGLCIPCTKPRYNRWFRNRSGYTQHMNAKHPTFLTPPRSPSLAPDITDFGDTGPMDDEDPLQSTAEFVGTGDRLYRNYHPFLSVQAGSKCTVFSDHRDLYKKIDNTPLGDVKWQSFSVKYTGAIPDEGALPWMEDSHDVWFRDPREVVRNMLANPDFATEMNLQPYREFATENHERQWKDFMSGDWSWAHADKISEDPDTHGSTFVPVILGSDNTTVSVATGQNDYYPLYASIGNVQNNVRRAHRNAVAVIGFLAMPKTTKEHTETPGFRNFRRQLFHSSLSFILKNLKPVMMKPEVARFGDGHYWRVIYGLGPYIADYEEQVLLACILRNWCAKCLSRRGNLDEINLCRSRSHTDALIEECDSGTLKSEYGLVGELVPFMNDFPHADIHELLAPDILHQLIKGAYKDHLVEWVEKYLLQTHGKKQANIILDDIDRRIAAVPPFPGLRRFPQGRHFKQWTGDDSKALMKVYLPAIEGYVPVDVVRAFQALLEFCYLVRRNVITEKSLSEIEDALTRFHTYREVFKTTGVVTTFSLPRQHSMSHYVHLIRLFGAPNGLCSSITESKHIKAVKEPWRRSSRFKALGQMLLVNQRLDKLAASRVDFRVRGMLAGRKRAQSVHALANELDIPHLADLVSQFLVGQLYLDMDPTEVPDSLIDCPRFDGKIQVFNSAVSVFFAPSDLSGIGGMKHEYIRVSPKWRSGHARKDCVYSLFFSFRLRGVYYPCAVVRWFNRVGNTPDDDTGMWMVEPSSVDHHAHFAVIHVDTIFRSAHLIPVYGTDMLPLTIKSHHVLDIFTLFYVNKYADHHAFEIAC